MITKFKIFEDFSDEEIANYRNLRPLFPDFDKEDYVKTKSDGKIWRVEYSYESQEYKIFRKDPIKYMKDNPVELEPSYYTYRLKDISSDRIIYCNGNELIKPEDYEIESIKYNL